MVDLQPTEMTAKTSDQNNRMPRVLIILEATPKQSLQLHLRKVCTQFESANGVRKEVTRPQCASKDTLTAQILLHTCGIEISKEYPHWAVATVHPPHTCGI